MHSMLSFLTSYVARRLAEDIEEVLQSNPKHKIEINQIELVSCSLSCLPCFLLILSLRTHISSTTQRTNPFSLCTRGSTS